MRTLTPRQLLLTSTLLLLPGLVTACGSANGAFANPFTQQIEVTLSPSTVTLMPGSGTRVQLTGAANGTAVTGLAVTASDVPDGLVITPSTGAVTVAANSTMKPGTYSIPLSVTAPGGQGSAQLAVSVVAPDYAVTFTGNPLALTAGASLRVSFTATRDSKPVPQVRVLKVTGALATSVGSDPLGFTVQAAPDQTVGTYTLLVTTTDGTITRVDPLTVNVSAAATK